ncbi:MAG TPA: RpiB/LacA/LacB family sugar-phosphate isomerase [Candidatus Paceibacterota bacterium]
MKIYLGADHRGFSLKEALKRALIRDGYGVEDVGAFVQDPNDDYPDFAYAVAQKVAKTPEENRGVLICGSGMGMDVVANKVKGIRATVAYSKESAAHARTNDDINIITLAGDVLSFDEAVKITDVFLKTPFSNEERHLRRLEKITKIEEENFK